MDLRETMTRKVGPLPVWGWGAVGLVGSFAAVRWLKRAKGAGTTASTADNYGAYQSGYDNGAASAGGSGGGLGGIPSSSLYQSQPLIQDQQSQGQLSPLPAKPASATPLLVSKPNGDPTHDAAIQNPYVSSYLQSLYLAQQPKMSSPTGDAAHDAAIQDPNVSRYLQSLYLSRN